MRELNEIEIHGVGAGSSLAYDIGYWMGHGVGEVVGDMVRSAMCEMINSQFQQAYG
jgi:hypothetical protein